MYLRAQAHPLMAMQQQGPQIQQLLAGHPDGRKPLFYQQLQNQFRIATIVFLFARLRGANLGGVPDLAFDAQLFQQVQKPPHRSNRFDAHQHRARKFGIKLPHLVAFVHQRAIHHFSAYGVEHRQGLLTSV